MRKTIIIFMIFITFINSPSVSAQDSTSSANFQAKLKALQEEIASKAAKLKSEVSKKLQNKAFVGFVKSKSENSLTLATKTGTKIININEYTEFVGGTKLKKFNFASLEIESYLAALGDIDETEVLIAKRVIKLEPVNEEKMQITFGKIVLLGEENFTIKTLDNKNSNFTANAKTVYQLGRKKADFEDIKLNKPIVVVSSGDLTKARFVYIFPYSLNIQPEKEGTPSTSSGQAPSTASKSKK